MDDDEWIALETIIRLEWSLPKQKVSKEKKEALEDIFKP
jgi:predicted Zn-dependent peptidase